MGTITYGLSIKGNAHYKHGIECQDSIAFTKENETPDYRVVAVADGHGGSPYFRSKTGSRFAVTIAKKEMEAFLERNKKDLDEYEALKGLHDENDPDMTKLNHDKEFVLLKKIQEDFKSVKTAIVDEWSEAVLRDFSEKPVHIATGDLTWLRSVNQKGLSEPFNGYCELEDNRLRLLNLDLPENIGALIQKSPKILYGSTLLCVGKYGPHNFVLQLGDGDIVAISKDGSPINLIQKNEKQIANETDSLCQNQAISKMQAKYYFGDTRILMLSTDGVANALEAESDIIELAGGIYDCIVDEPESIKKDFPGFLRRFSEGSSDDCTLGFIASNLDEEKQKMFQTVETGEDVAPKDISRAYLLDEYAINDQYYLLQQPESGIEKKFQINATKIGMEAITGCFLRKEFQDLIQSWEEYKHINGKQYLIRQFLKAGESYLQKQGEKLLNRQTELYRKEIAHIVAQNPVAVISLTVLDISAGETGEVNLTRRQKQFAIVEKIHDDEITLAPIGENAYQFILTDFPHFLTIEDKYVFQADCELHLKNYDLTLILGRAKE